MCREPIWSGSHFVWPVLKGEEKALGSRLRKVKYNNFQTYRKKNLRYGTYLSYFWGFCLVLLCGLCSRLTACLSTHQTVILRKPLQTHNSSPPIGNAAGNSHLRLNLPMNFFETFPESSLLSTVRKTIKMIAHHSRLRDMIGQSYPIYVCTSAYHAHYLSVHVTFCGSSKHTLFK